MNGWNGLRGIALNAVVALAIGGTMSAAAVAQDARAPAAAGGATKQDAEHRQSDIGRHRAIATAHEAAARCLERGEKESSCHEALRKACQGIAVGRYCGMKHSH